MKYNIDQSLQIKIDNLLVSYKKKEYEVTKDLALSIVKEIPEHILSWKILGSVYLEIGQKDEAFIATQNVVRLSSKDPEAHNNLGVVLFKLSKLEEAEKSYKKAIELKPDYAVAHNNLGHIYRNFGYLEDAAKSYTKAIELKPDFTVAHYKLGIIYQQLGKLKDAEKSYKKAIELKPDYAEAHNNLGYIYNELKNLKDAEKSYKKAIELKPDYAEAYLNLGKLFKELEQTNEAIKYFEKSLKIDIKDVLGTNLELASLGKKKIPNKTPIIFMQNFYKSKANIWDSFEAQKYYYGKELIKVAFKQTHKKKFKIDILDLGCGTGSLGSFLSSYAKTLTGIDLSADMLTIAEKTGFYDLLHKKEIELYLSKTLINYDSIVAAAVMIHFFDLESLFTLINKSLKSKGKFIFSVFESTKNDKEFNSFLMYSHSDHYITTLANRFKFKINYRQIGVHEYRKGIPINAIIYVLQKS